MYIKDLLLHILYICTYNNVKDCSSVLSACTCSHCLLFDLKEEEELEKVSRPSLVFSEDDIPSEGRPGSLLFSGKKFQIVFFLSRTDLRKLSSLRKPPPHRSQALAAEESEGRGTDRHIDRWLCFVKAAKVGDIFWNVNCDMVTAFVNLMIEFANKSDMCCSVSCTFDFIFQLWSTCIFSSTQVLGSKHKFPNPQSWHCETKTFVHKAAHKTSFSIATQERD